MISFRRALPGIAAAILSLLLAACSVSEDTKQADEAVQTFHELLDTGQSSAIYLSSGDEMKKTTSQQDFVTFLDAVHRKLGNSKTAVRSGWNENYTPAGKFLAAAYKTDYADGDAAETFTFRIGGPKPILIGYNINSRALIVK